MKVTLHAEEYIEFETGSLAGLTEWVKAILQSQGVIETSPENRDPYDGLWIHTAYAGEVAHFLSVRYRGNKLLDRLLELALDLNYPVGGRECDYEEFCDGNCGCGAQSIHFALEPPVFHEIAAAREALRALLVQAVESEGKTATQLLKELEAI